MSDISAACIIRPIIDAELGVISDLAMRSKAQWAYSSTFLEACRQELTYTAQQLDGEMIFYAAEFSGRLIAFYALAPLNPEVCELEALFVEPKFIGCGVGRTLMLHAIAVAQDQGARAIEILSDPNAETFYQKLGAERISMRPSDSISGRFLPLLRLRIDQPGDREYEKQLQ